MTLDTDMKHNNLIKLKQWFRRIRHTNQYGRQDCSSVAGL